MTPLEIRSAAASFCFGQICVHLPEPLRSECARMGFFDRHSATLAPNFEALRDRVFAWADRQEKEEAA